MAKGIYRNSQRSHHKQDPAKRPICISGADVPVFSRRIPCIKIWKMDYNRISQLKEQRLECHSGALQNAGFVIADVRTLDKGKGSFKQVTSAGAVKQDLIISAYKPNGGLEGRFKLAAGTEEGVWDFVRTHLKQLPVFVSKNSQAEMIAERQHYLLFDRMVAFHVQRGVTVLLSAAEFYAGLEQRFPTRDGMYFLPDQAAEYDKKRMTVKEVFQLQLFVSDEASAIQWLKQQITKKPQNGRRPETAIHAGDRWLAEERKDA